jgi:hypothetical protein
MLFDRQQTVREIACDWLTGQGKDVAKHYIAVLEGASQPANKIRCALWAIVKFKWLDALPLAQRLMNHSSPKVRSSAILTCAKLDSKSIENLIEIALADDWPSINKVAAQLVRISGLRAPYSSVQKLLQSADQALVGLQIARANGKWDWLLALFDAILIWRGSNETIVEYALSEMRVWIQLDSSSYANPTRGQSDLLKVQMQRGVLENCPGYAEQLKFILQCTGVSA